MEYQWLKHLARIHMPVYLFETDTMKILYAGYSSIKKEYFIRFIMDRDYNHTFIGRKWFWEIPGLFKSSNADMIISELSWISLNFFQKRNGFILPVWANMKINIDLPLSEIIQNRKSVFTNITRRIRKHNLTYEVFNDNENFENFINKFYLPYVTSRYGEEALIEDLYTTWKAASSPFLMAIKEDGVIVAESFYKKSGDTLDFVRLGLLDGNKEYLSHGVIGALYYFRILEGQKMGCRYINPGATRPFLTDGLTINKVGLGAEFITDYSPWNEYLWLGVNHGSSVTQEFLHNHPFMHLNKDHLLVKYGT